MAEPARTVQTPAPAPAPPARASAPAQRAAVPARLGPGEPLPAAVRVPIERGLGADLGGVRVFSGSGASQAAATVRARAFTYGPNIVLGAGERASDLPLMAHEAAHVLQQRGAPAAQPFSLAGGDPLEREAQRAASAVAQGGAFSVQGQTAGARLQRLGLSDILDGLADLAANLPGFTLLTVIIGRNPINQRPVERSFTNILRGFMGLLPGGELLFQVLSRYGVVERLGAWVGQQTQALGLTYDDLRRRFSAFTDSLSWRDIFSPRDVWRRAEALFSEPVTKIRSLISRLIDQAVAWLKETFMQPLSEFCRQIPGYGLVTVLLGRDPFTGAAVPRTALNVVRAFAEFIPGGTERVNQLVESRALQRAYEWFLQETQARNLTWARVTGTFAQAWASLRLEDVLSPIETLRRMVGLFRPLLSDLVGFAGAALIKLLELIFEAVMGAGGARILAILKRARATFETIIRDPVGFLRNLIGAVGQGVRQFMTNILQHLQQGVIAWLTGPVARAGVQIPARWDLAGTVGFVLQILGLTWPRVRQKLVRLLGERVVAGLEAGFQLLQEIREKGLVQALRDRVTEFFGQLRETALGSIRSFIQQRLVRAGIEQLLSLLSPVGAVIQAIIKTYTTIQFFIQRINQILDLVESIVNSIAAIASGSIGAAAGLVERTMAHTIPVILDFLARFIGLGDVGGHVQRTIQGLQARVDAMLDRAVEWIRTMAQRVGAGVRATGARIANWWQKRRNFTVGNEQHAVYFSGQENQAELMVASRPVSWPTFVSGLASYPSPQGVAAKNAALAAATTLRNTIRRPASSFGTPSKDQQVEQELNDLALALGTLLRLSPPGTNLYPGSGLDPRTRTVQELWNDILPAPIPGTTETPRDIEFRRVLARGRLLQHYPAARRPTAQAMINFNLGRQIKTLNLAENDSANTDAHTVKRHVLNGQGEIQNKRDLALRVLLNVPSTNNTWTAGAYRSVSNAQQAIRTAITSQIAAVGWPRFRETIIATTGNANAIPGDVPAPASGDILHNPGGTAANIADLPAYLSTSTFQGIPLAGAAGTRPLYPGDNRQGVTGVPLTTPLTLSGKIRVVMRTQATSVDGWYILTSYPVP